MTRLGSLLSAFLLLLCGCASGGSSSVPSGGASGPPSQAARSSAASLGSQNTTKLTGVFTSLAGNQVPLWVAQDGGILRQHGIDLSSSLLQGSPAMASLLSGETQVVQGGGSEILAAAAEGGDLVALSTLDPYFDFVFVVPNRIQSFADLKGKKLGIAPPGGTVYIATRLVLKRVGLDPDKDVTQVSMGVTQQRAVALQSGAIDGSLLDIVTGKKLAEGGGFHIIYDLATQKVPYATASTVVRKSWLAANRELTQRYIDALIEGISRTKQDKAFAMATYKKFTKVDSDVEVEQTYDYFKPILLSQPFPTVDQFADTARILGEVNPKLASLNLSAVIDDSFVRNAVDRGIGRT
jgi:ABC-type nitrate/sulfonate/bicarbonate transport system substrate-binding protein